MDYESMTDSDILKRIRVHDDDAMEYLLKKHSRIVKRETRTLYLIGAEMEDLAQEGMIGLYGAIGDYEEGDLLFKNFAYLCVTRRILDAVKASGRQKNRPLNNYVSLFDSEIDMPVADPLEDMIDRENGEELYRKINEELSDFEFRILTLYMKGMSTAEICRICKKNEKSVDNALQRSKKKLEKLLKR